MNALTAMKNVLGFLEDEYPNAPMTTKFRTAIAEMERVEPVAWIDEDLNLRMGKPRVAGPLYLHPKTATASSRSVLLYAWS